MGRVEHIGGATLYLGDCRDILPSLGPADAVVTDPPYGIGEAAGKNASRGKLAVSKDYGDEAWDDEPIADDLMAMVRASARWNIIFGGNFYASAASSCWLIWDKENGDSDFADCEMAWTNLPGAVRRLRFMWNGMLRAHGEERGDHPTQKPVGVMKWVISKLPPDTRSILDPFMGSGTTGVAALQSGKQFVGIEISEKYFDIACARVADALRQRDLFIEYDDALDAKLSYDAAVRAIGERVKAGEPIPDFFLPSSHNKL